nr:immunoglobulin light chain junction region [Macaca mulatta]
CQQDYYWPLTF